jgi:hypothetical protein
MAVTAKESLDHAGSRLESVVSVIGTTKYMSQEDLLAVVRELAVAVGYLHDAIRKTREEHSLGF